MLFHILSINPKCVSIPDVLYQNVILFTALHHLLIFLTDIIIIHIKQQIKYYTLEDDMHIIL